MPTTLHRQCQGENQARADYMKAREQRVEAALLVADLLAEAGDDEIHPEIQATLAVGSEDDPSADPVPGAAGCPPPQLNSNVR